MSLRYVFVSVILVLALSVPQRVFAAGQMWGNDVLVHQANHIYGFGMDQADKDTLFLVVSDSSTTNLRDTIYSYRSTDNGKTWNLLPLYYSGVDNWRFGKSDVAAAKGDLDAVYVFYIFNHRLWCKRYPYASEVADLYAAISDLGENVVDFAVCHDLYSYYYLYVAYQTDQDSVIFKCTESYDTSWVQRVNLTESTPITSQPSIAWSRGYYLVVAGKTSDDKIYTIRNTYWGDSLSWVDGKYPSGQSNCDHPVVAGSHTLPDTTAVFWVFYERYITTPSSRWITNFQWSTDAGKNWFATSVPNDTSSGNRVLPSLHVLEEEDVSNITFGYRWEYNLDPREVRYIYKADGQGSPSVWNATYTGITDYEPHHTPQHRVYTLRMNDNTVASSVLYVNWSTNDLYFSASSFTGVEDETEYQAIKGFALGQNYPNPFNSSTSIEYNLENDGRVEIAVYNILGQKVKTLFDGSNSRGNHRIIWDGTDNKGNTVPSGVYFYKLKSERKTESRKMVLMK